MLGKGINKIFGTDSYQETQEDAPMLAGMFLMVSLVSGVTSGVLLNDAYKNKKAPLVIDTTLITKQCEQSIKENTGKDVAPTAKAVKSCIDKAVTAKERKHKYQPKIDFLGATISGGMALGCLIAGGVTARRGRADTIAQTPK